MHHCATKLFRVEEPENRFRFFYAEHEAAKYLNTTEGDLSALWVSQDIDTIVRYLNRERYWIPGGVRDLARRKLDGPPIRTPKVPFEPRQWVVYRVELYPKIVKHFSKLESAEVHIERCSPGHISATLHQMVWPRTNEGWLDVFNLARFSYRLLESYEWKEAI